MENYVRIKRTKLNDRNMTAVWEMHENGKSPKQICNALDLSSQSVSRIIKAMEMVKRGNLQQLYGYSAISANIIDFAKHYFGVDNEPEEAKNEPAPPDNTALILTKIVYALERNNYLLERIAAELGVKNIDDVKG